MDARPVMSKLDLVLANPVPCPQGPPPPQWGGRGEGETVSTSNPGWQLTKCPLRVEEGQEGTR